MRELSASALFGARFRENAARALLLPRAYPGKRTPLWQQRLKAQSLLEVAKRYGQFPIVLETYRECLRDVLDLPALDDLLRKLHRRELSLVEVETPRASPFASSLLFDYVATYMYEGDTPNAERRAAALSLDRDLLRELLGQEELRELIDADALAEVEASLQRLTEQMRAANTDSLHDALRGARRPDHFRRRRRAASRRCRPRGCSSSCAGERRAVAMRIGGEERWIAAEDAGLYRDAFGAVPPGGLPETFLASVEEPLARIVRRYARTHGPFTTAEVSRRYAVDLSAGAARARARRRAGARRAAARRVGARVVRRGGAAAAAARLALAAQGGRAGRAAALARLLPSWQGVDSSPPTGAGIDRLREVLVPLQGVALAPEVWERDVLPRRVGAYSQAWMDQLCAGGELVWVGAGAVGRRSGRVALYFRDDARWLGPPPYKGELPSEPVHIALRERLGRGACFWTDLLVDVGEFEPSELQEGLWDLVWAGEVTNDAFAPAARAAADAGAAAALGTAARRFGRRRRPARAADPGPLVADGAAVRRRPAHGPRMRALAEVMLERYGIVTRETVLAEGMPGGFAALYGELANLETLGTARRGYFVEGLGGAQFALGGAVERLRGLRSDEPAGAAGPGRDRSGQPVRRVAAVAERSESRRAEPHPRRVRGDARRRARALRRARRPRHPAPGRILRARSWRRRSALWSSHTRGNAAAPFGRAPRR